MTVPCFVAVVSAALLTANVCRAEPKADQPLTLNAGEVVDCPEFSDLPMRATKMTFRVDHKDGDMYVNSSLVLDQALDDPVTLRFDIFKCLAKEEDSCKIERIYERETICDDIGKQGMVWSPMLASIEGFEAKCPVPAGTYKMVDGPITRSIRETLPMYQGFWRLKATLAKNGTMLGCMRGYGEVKQKRRERSKSAAGK